MGVIQRQGIKHSIVNFVGLLIGTASTLFIYSQAEAIEAYGLVQYLLGIAMIGYPVFALSGNTIAFRFFPKFQDKTKQHHGFSALLLLFCLLGWGVLAGIALLLWETILGLIDQDSPLLKDYLWVAFPLTFFYTLSQVLGVYSANFKRIVIPSILNDFALKIFLPVQLVAVWQGWISLPTALWLLLLHFFLVTLGLIYYLHRLGEWTWRINWSILTPTLRQDMLRYASFGIVSSLAFLIATKSDTVMVGSLIDIKKTAVYAIALNIAAAIDIPTKSLYTVSASFVARYLEDENWTEMRDLYRKVSINLLTAGLLLFGCIWVSARDLYALMPNTAEVSQGLYVLFFMCIAKLVDMASGLNNQLVYFSRHYRFSILSLGILAVANVAFNLWLIPIYGLNGAAISTLISVACYNVFNLFLVYRKMNMQPFSWQTLLVVGLAVGVMTAVWWVPSTGYLLLNIGLRSGLFALGFGGLVLYFRVSADLNQLWEKALQQLKKAAA
ncbi:MAG: polysaccharide biosynthesis C-terminal domain-containing protein [Saprospiraceae bacterium]|nr:polysaccharide biosynthesis C-terminal domain-containing protein [Saprospiraceae bacterium]